MSSSYDIHIKGGTIVDGTLPRYRGDPGSRTGRSPRSVARPRAPPTR
ncbi:MAG: hypothetical protein R2755_13385 [Acidimicrobiales bacterium]